MQKSIPVTVGIATYNSSKFIIDTLESIRTQTYPYLKLIVSDDCSTDNTIDLVKDWVDKNRVRFINVKILTVPHNTGVSANFNRIWDACDTEWEKDIAGDDMLLPNCIEDNMKYVTENPSSIVVFSRVRPFKVFFGKKIFRKDAGYDYGFFNLPKEKQKSYLLRNGNRLPAPPCFYNINKLRELNIRHDERIPLMEDYPKWITFARMGITFSFMDKHTVGYRKNSNSLSAGLFRPSYFKSNLLFYLYYYLDEIHNETNRDEVYNQMCDEILLFYTRTYNTAINIGASWDYKIGHALLFPYHLVRIIYKIVSEIIKEKSIPYIRI